MYKYLLLIFMFSILIQTLWSQIPKKDAVENMLEKFSELKEEEIDYSALYEDLVYFSYNRLNLNEAGRDDLEKLQFLSDFNIEDILEYIREYGEMLSIWELQYLESFNENDIKRLLPFITVEPKQKRSGTDLRKALKFGKNSLFLRTRFLLQDQKGFLTDSPENKSYLGNKYKYYTRYQFNYKRRIKFGFVAEKDAGEEFSKDSKKYGFDYYSFHLEINDIGKLKSLNLGDYQVRFGQGLIAWTGFSLGKSSFVTNIKKKYDGLRKYSSSDENNFMRGAGATIDLGKFDLTGFISHKHIDGNLANTDSLTDEEDYFVSFQTTGLHRNADELSKRKSVSEFIYGGNIKFKGNKFKLSASYIEYFFGKELNKEPTAYNSFDFNGDHGFNGSIDYQTYFKKIYFFGEEAVSMNGAYALLNSMMIKPAAGISLAVLQRYYTKDYRALYASGFSEQSKTQNENGIYMGTVINPFRKLTISSYIDIFQFPWLKYRVYAPSSGHEFYTQLDYKILQNLDFQIKYKQELKEINTSDSNYKIYTLTQTQKRQLRFHLYYSFSDNLTLKNRIQFSEYKASANEKESGFMIYQDICYKSLSLPLKVDFRIAFFDTDYYTRMFAYENDILYAYSFPAYNGRGIRTYISLKYTLIKDIMDIWVRFANTSYSPSSPNVSETGEIGTNYDAVEGLNKSEVKFQIRIKF